MVCIFIYALHLEVITNQSAILYVYFINGKSFVNFKINNVYCVGYFCK